MMTKIATLLAATALVHPVSFETGNAGWKRDADGKLIADTNGNPIYVGADGTEMVTESGTIARLNAEAKTNRLRAEKAEESLKAFDGLDADKARGALDTVSKIDQKKLIDAGEVDKVREEVGKSYTERLQNAERERDQSKAQYDNLFKSSTLSQSSFIDKNIAVPKDMFLDKFGSNFKVEDGKLVPYDGAGNKIYSKKRAGEVADVDEAFDILVEAYPHKESILKPADARGSGGGSGGGSRGGGRYISRSQFDAMGPMEKAQIAEAQGKGEVTITE